MLVFLVLCAFLRTLHGASIPPPSHEYSSSATVGMSNLVTCEAPVAPDDSTQQLRTVYDIVQSCLLTIVACVWTSIHQNINGPRDSWWTCMKRRGTSTLCAVIAPELILLWALNQRQAAKTFAVEYNKLFATSRLFKPLHKETTWRGDGQSWTTAHGFFIQMGGFILYENGYPKEVLDYERLVQLLQDKAIDAPTVTERNLQDRSKGDTISKGIVVLQTTWFIFQYIAPTTRRLPVSELEVLTLAFAVMNTAIYAAWWDKPQGVDTAICVPLRRAAEEQHEPANLSHATEITNLPQPECHNSDDNAPLIQPQEQKSNEGIGQKHSWIRRKLREDWEQFNSLVFFLIRLPYRIGVNTLRSLNKVSGGGHNIDREGLRMPIFYERNLGGTAVVQASCTIGAIFGAIHLLVWASHFPSPRDLTLWRISAIIMTVQPILLLAYSAKYDILTAISFCLFVLLIPAYIAARFVVMVIALKAIRDPPHDVLLDVSWTSCIPHF
ncbi:hypothetical protein D9619_010565 [Psilocybe cf. subviscida]|uniref:Uncharacterized protein n=1 Tax=Psilocybe cf. subviscida TaxID=2480587 RepID=A0A8H5ERQ4_9AGAR|nr:hypothetical protein D9619_010565 [Psilocybe cf. subviscida]